MGAWAVLLLVLVLLWLLLRDFGLISLKQKISAIVLLGALGAFLMFYTYKQDRENQNQMELQRAFLRGETLICRHVHVNNKEFNFVAGTLSFLGKKNTPKQGMLVDLQTCMLAKP
ncbi:hypothetical protein [Helicobacter bizzozeronii]|uniref:hypothetical protein n=1 Tax=Helicobacter bizzozeronii TaxID=56877 RepID=UPI000CEF1BEF|nr:hypothetical protein [Helicobacter bizzozeronii]GMT38322.1 Putative membrane protein [Helicobacter bizzozeronii]